MAGNFVPSLLLGFFFFLVESQTETISYKFHRALLPSRSSMYNSFVVSEILVDLPTIIACLGYAATTYGSSPDFWRTAAKFEPHNKTCTIGKVHSRAIKMLREEFEAIRIDDPEALYICNKCQEPIQEHVMILPGNPEWSNSPEAQNVEIVNVLTNSLVCSSNIGLLEAIKGVSMLFGDSLIVCPPYESPCVQHDLRSKATTTYPHRMMKARSYVPVAIEIDFNEYWIPGGDDGSTILDSTEFFKDGQFTWGPQLPVPLAESCVVKLDIATFVIVGGRTTSGAFSSVYLYDMKNNVWHNLEPLNLARYGHACGTVKRDQSEEIKIIVFGGITASGTTGSVEVMDWNNGLGKWRFGQGTQYTLQRCKSVQYKEYFLTFGGYVVNGGGIKSQGYIGSIHKCTFDEQCQEVEGIHTGPRDDHAVLKIEKEFAKC